MDAKQLRDLGQQLRVDAVHAAAAAGSGHPTSSMSAADLMAVLLAEHLRYDFTMPGHPGNDRVSLVIRLTRTWIRLITRSGSTKHDKPGRRTGRFA